MTRKEFWLKLFAENDIALASALISADRFTTDQQLQRGKEYIESIKKELYEEMPLNVVQSVFPNYHPTEREETMTDNEKIKLMERFRNVDIIRADNGRWCVSIGDVLDIINDQKAEIEGLEDEIGKQFRRNGR